MRILYVTTTFPVYSETFLQREVRALSELQVDLKIVSLHGGSDEFEGIRVHCFNKWRLLTLIWKLPVLVATRFDLFRTYTGAWFRNRPRDWINFWENMLGLGAAIVWESDARAFRADIVHCVWSSAPAAFGWLLMGMGVAPFSMGAHAYDVFEKGGDWLLDSKLAETRCVHTSTGSAANALVGRVDAKKVHLIRRGLNAFPEFATLRATRDTLRVVCVARLVEKKGFPYQLSIYEAMRKAGIAFEARIVGEGRLMGFIEAEIAKRSLSDCVRLVGRLPFEETLSQLAWADVLFHTGVVAANGDRDGLPNVIPEAMASGALVVASPVSGVVEAIEDETTGFLASVEDPDAWVAACQRIQRDDAICERIRARAREWVEREFSAKANTKRLLDVLSRGSN